MRPAANLSMRITPRWVPTVQDPNAILLAFPLLKLKEELSLVAYNWVESTFNHSMSTSFTKVYALYPGACYEDPITLKPSIVKKHRKKGSEEPYPVTPIPGLSAKDEDLPSALTFNPNIKSYFQAIVFRLEVQDFPGYWEDHWNYKNQIIPWSTHEIIEEEPNHYCINGTSVRPVKIDEANHFPSPFVDAPASTLKQTLSNDWRPTINHVGKQVVAEFYTVTTWNRISVFQHKVVFNQGSYSPTSWESKKIADFGPGAMCD